MHWRNKVRTQPGPLAWFCFRSTFTRFVLRNMREMLHKNRVPWSRVFGKLNLLLEVHIYKSILRPLRSLNKNLFYYNNTYYCLKSVILQNVLMQPLSNIVCSRGTSSCRACILYAI